jgi:hypothetical protein
LPGGVVQIDNGVGWIVGSLVHIQHCFQSFTRPPTRFVFLTLV